MGTDAAGLPIGLQIVGPELGEPVVFRVAKAIENLVGFDATPALATSEGAA